MGSIASEAAISALIGVWVHIFRAKRHTEYSFHADAATTANVIDNWCEKVLPVIEKYQALAVDL